MPGPRSARSSGSPWAAASRSRSGWAIPRSSNGSERSARAPRKRTWGAAFAEVVRDPTVRPHLIWIAVGKDDFLLKRNEAFHAWLGGQGIAHTWTVSDGGHEWPVWRSYLPQFLELAFR